MEKSRTSRDSRMSEAEGKEKQTIREYIRRRRQALSAQEKALLDRAVLRQFSSALDEMTMRGPLPAVYCYASIGGEPDTYALIKHMRQRGISVALPRVEGEKMRFYFVPDTDRLKAGYRGIMEPDETCKKADIPGVPMIVPGAAFTPDGGRLGLGGGFYDRFLDMEPEHTRIAVCYPFQIFDELPMEAHDKWMDIVITGEHILYGKRSEGKDGSRGWN